MTTELDEQAELANIVSRLATRYPGLAEGDIAVVVDEVYASMQGARVRDFVPVLVERESKKLLKQAHSKSERAGEA